MCTVAGVAACDPVAEAPAEVDAGPTTSDAGDTWPHSDAWRPPAVPDPCPPLYAQDVLPVFQLELADGELAALRDEQSQWMQRAATGLPIAPAHPASLSLGGDAIDDVAVSLLGPAWSWQPPKLQLVIDVDPAGVGRRFHGVRHIDLEAAPYDPSLLRSRLALALFRRLGLPASCGNNARLVINGGDQGVYANLEHQDEVFLERVFPGGGGGVLWHDGWQPETPPTALAFERLNDLQAAVTVTDLTALVDLDQAVHEWAVEAVMPHGDGYWGLGARYALYDHPDAGFMFLPSGLAASFDWTEATADPVTWTGAWSSGPPEPYLATLADPAWHARYLDAVRDATLRYDAAAMRAELVTWSGQIADAVAADPMRSFTFDEHNAAVSRLRAYLIPRRAFLDGWLDCSQDGGGDGDGDGTPWCFDCNDDDASIHPGAVEVCDNAIDEDCNGRRDDGCPVGD